MAKWKCVVAGLGLILPLGIILAFVGCSSRSREAAPSETQDKVQSTSNTQPTVTQSNHTNREGMDISFGDTSEDQYSSPENEALVRRLASLGYVEDEEDLEEAGARCEWDLEVSPASGAYSVARRAGRARRGGLGGARFLGGSAHAPAIPGSLPADYDELWVVQRAEEDAPAEDSVPGCGALMAVRPGEETRVAVPLKHTDVQAQISAYIATVDVTQQYQNPYDEKIEALYVFPLPQNAAVNDFIMTVGDRRIRGIIRDREEAKKAYEAAKRQGKIASLLTQERANIFTQKVANIEPGKAIDINIKYFHTLAYVDGWYEYVFPMVVGPRFNPSCSTDGVGAVSRGVPGKSGQPTEVQYLKPTERSGHDIALSVQIDAGVAIEEVECRNHVIETQRDGDGRAIVKLGDLDTIPNKDFVLRYKVAGDRIKSALLTHRDERGGFFTLMLYPPADLTTLKRKPVEMIFVLDCSGSMSGEPIAQAKKAIERGLRHMQPEDSFQIIRFSNDASQLGGAPLIANQTNISRGLRYLNQLDGSGGTMMIEGIKAALDFPHDPNRLRFVAFLTDGYIGNEAEILGEMRKRLGASRVFSFGVGSSPNRFLLDRMAKLGSGAVAYLSLNDDAGLVMDRFFERISHPALADVQIAWGDMNVSDVFPSRLPDLFVGRPVIVTGRFEGDTPTQIVVSGSSGTESIDIPIAANLADATATHRGLPCVWARAKIADLADRMTYVEAWEELPGAIKQVALEYGLMSAYTAFVAVDSLSQTAGDHGTTVAVPVPVPDGVKYETTVTN